MNILGLAEVLAVVKQLETSRTGSQSIRILLDEMPIDEREKSWGDILDHGKTHFLSNIARAEQVCRDNNLSGAASRLREIFERTSNGHVPVDVSTVLAETEHALSEILRDLGSKKYLVVNSDVAELLENSDFMGKDVLAAFPSAAEDIKQAGNCLAAECTTAAVFHLMRCAEFGLHALARDRDVDFPNKPIEESEWGVILGNLDSKVADLRKAPRSSWSDSNIRDSQIRFYSEVIVELRGFNDAFRKHVSHADKQAFYNRKNALGIMEHVKAFMSKLSARISEQNVTEKYWK